MVLPGHLAGGYLATQALLHALNLPLTPSETITITALGTLAGEIPDIDLFFFYFHQKFSRAKIKKASHRSYTTHAPFFWLAISAIIALSGYFANSAFTGLIGLTLLVGTWSHFLIDSIEYGITWLWPFSDTRFCLRHVIEPDLPGQKGGLTYYWKWITSTYWKRITFYAEIVITALAIWVAFRG